MTSKSCEQYSSPIYLIDGLNIDNAVFQTRTDTLVMKRASNSKISTPKPFETQVQSSQEETFHGSHSPRVAVWMKDFVSARLLLGLGANWNYGWILRYLVAGFALLRWMGWTLILVEDV
jgi:hypothetical protein